MMQGKYGEDTSTHPNFDEGAYRFAAGQANRGICYGLGSTTQSALRLSGSQCGSSRASRSSQSTAGGPTPDQAVVHAIDPDIIRRLEVIEERMLPQSTMGDPEHIQSVVRGIMQEEMRTMRAEVIEQVTSHVTSNVVVDVAQRVSDILSEQLNTNFITQLRASEERQKKQRQMENRARDQSLFLAMIKGSRPDEGASQDDDTQPPPDSTK